MPRNYWRPSYNRSRRALEPERAKPPTDPLYERARYRTSATNSTMLGSRT